MTSVQQMAQSKVQRLAGWGRYPVAAGCLETPGCESEIRAIVTRGGSNIARGNGRSYGDSSFNTHGTISLLRLSRMLHFDPRTGEFAAEAGVLLGDIIRAVLADGWFLPVTPGTKFVTLGGAIAADVHGKNSVLDGSFGHHVTWLELMVADGSVIRCSPTENAALFHQTIGGMGLTGVILRAAFKLKAVETGWMRQRKIVAPNLDAVLSAFEANEGARYRVAWIDVLQRGAGLGRSVLDVAEHATRAELRPAQRPRPFEVPRKRTLAVPFALPVSPLNGMTVSAFNALIYQRGKAKAGESLVDWDTYFYPLDAVLHWNRIYGRRGFAQYQCVLPMANAREGLVELLEEISRSRIGSFLAVLKRLGDGAGALSFPIEGYTLALDFPWSRATGRLLDRLDGITCKYNGRLYLAKDARVAAGTFRAMHPGSAAFANARDANGAGSAFASLQSQRLKL